jgi:hypothetical protein
VEMQSISNNLSLRDVHSNRRMCREKTKKHKAKEMIVHFDIIKESIQMSKKDIWISLGVLVVAVMFVVLYIKLSFIIAALS